MRFSEVLIGLWYLVLVGQQKLHRNVKLFCFVLYNLLNLLTKQFFTIKSVEDMHQVSLTINENELEKLLSLINSFSSAKILSSNPINEDLSVWQKSELDKSLAEIENGTIQAESWEVVRDRLFAQYNVK